MEPRLPTDQLRPACESISLVFHSGEKIGRACIHAQRILDALEGSSLRTAIGSHTSLDSTKTLLHMAWEELHSGSWEQVSVTWREAYTLATVSTVLQSLLSESHDLTSCDWHRTRETCIRKLDIALLVGGPRMADVVHPLIEQLSQDSAYATIRMAPCDPFRNANKKISESETQRQSSRQSSSTGLRVLEPIAAPDLLSFEQKYMKQSQPCLMNGMADAWPAMERCASSLVCRAIRIVSEG